MARRLIGVGTFVTLLALATGASAQSPMPDLKGVWTGQVSYVRRGKSEHREPPSEPDATFGGPYEFTITIERQDGSRLAGTWSSARATDPLLGVIRPDGRRIHMVDDDGTFTIELHGSDEMEVCRTEVTPESMSALCGTLRRKR